MFRVGDADETLPARGITHLVEHLAMVPQHRRPYEVNAWVDEAYTSFAAEGSVDEVCDFLERVARALASLPLDQLEIQRRVLASEAVGRSTSLNEALTNMRFGAAGYGLGSFLELGLHGVTGADVEVWARRFFTAGNAVIVMTAPPPESLALELPPGERVPPPEPVTIPGLRVPAQHADGSGEVAMSFLTARSTALAVAGGIAERRAEDRLRMVDGITYHVEWDYSPLTAERAHAWLTADCADVNAPAVRDGLQATLEDLAEHGPDDAELAWVEAGDARWQHDEGLPVRVLVQAAEDLLVGLPLVQPAEWIEERRALTRDDVAAAVREALASELVLVPKSAAAARGGLPKHGRDVAPASGRTFRGTPSGPRRRRGRSIVLGEDRLTQLRPDAEPCTVPFDEVTALVDDRPGVVTLIGLDHEIQFTVSELERGEELERALRERVPESLVVPFQPSVAALARLAEGLEAPARTGDGLRELAKSLDPTETPLALVEGRRGRRTGLLLATDRRVVWLRAGRGEEQVELPWQAVRRVARAERRITVEAAEETLDIRTDGPASAPATFAEAATGRTTGGTTLSEA